MESGYVHLSEKQGKPKSKLIEDGEVTTSDLDSVYNSEWLNTNSAATNKSTRKEAKRRKRARNQATQHKNIAFVNLVEDPENSPPAVEEPPRSNNGVIFLIDGATAGNCISTFRKKKMLAEVFVTKKMKMKKKRAQG